MSERVHSVIIGGGVIGVAIAAVLARRGDSVVVLERNRKLGQETSARNSGVIHAGLYYPTESLKARLCLAGREHVYARCARDGVAHRACGKLVIASEPAELARLEAIFRQAHTNGAREVELIDGAEVRRRVPAVRAVAGLWSPRTGIVDAHGLIDSYRREAEAHGALFVVDHTVTALARRGEAWHVHARTASGEVSELACTWLVNAAGLEASRISALAGLDVDALGLRQQPCKGDYFVLAAKYRGFSPHLVYPLPFHAGLGVHITFDLDGRVMAGPDAEYVTAPRYDVDPGKTAAFGEAVRHYLPEVRDDELTPGYAGIRPKLQGPRDPFRDFVIEHAERHGAPGLIHLIGMDSPGLTSSEAIAAHVASLVR
ncbi:MAG TPA: NAD(P)/FAD-dependent oxidoreductase [Kofleriaceae bacterium]|nr:NAD(P)/FAD-dependent oxidoreductase [Kofleriaceae bacterium]